MIFVPEKWSWDRSWSTGRASYFSSRANTAAILWIGWRRVRVEEGGAPKITGRVLAGKHTRARRRELRCGS